MNIRPILNSMAFLAAGVVIGMYAHQWILSRATHACPPSPIIQDLLAARRELYGQIRDTYELMSKTANASYQDVYDARVAAARAALACETSLAARTNILTHLLLLACEYETTVSQQWKHGMAGPVDLPRAAIQRIDAHLALQTKCSTHRNIAIPPTPAAP